MQPIVAPPLKHPIMYSTPKSADGTGETPLTAGSFSATKQTRTRVRINRRVRVRVGVIELRLNLLCLWASRGLKFRVSGLDLGVGLG